MQDTFSARKGVLRKKTSPHPRLCFDFFCASGRTPFTARDKNMKYGVVRSRNTAIEASSDGEGEKVDTREREQDLFLRKTLSPLSSNNRAPKSLPTLAHDLYHTVHKTVTKEKHADRSKRSNENDAEYDLH